jgi:hypothetical protein
VLDFYRSTASSQELLRSAISADANALHSALESSPDLSRSGLADGGRANLPALPLLDDATLGDTAEALTRIARARLGAFVKYSAFCEVAGFVPLLPWHAYGGVLGLSLESAQNALLLSDDDGRLWAKRNRVLDLCHEEFLLDERLDLLSIEEVIRLRTKAWGRQTAARAKLFESVFAIANEIDDDEQFLSSAQNSIAEYRAASEEVVIERAKLEGWIKCEMVKGTLAGGLAVKPALAGLEGLLQSPLASIAGCLAIAGIWIANRYQELKPTVLDIQRHENDLRRGAGFGLHNFYSRLR